MGDIDALKNLVLDFDRVHYQQFLDAKAEIKVDLSALFPMPKESSITLSRSISSMLEISLANLIKRTDSNSVAANYGFDVGAVGIPGSTTVGSSGKLEVRGSGAGKTLVQHEAFLSDSLIYYVDCFQSHKTFRVHTINSNITFPLPTIQMSK